MKNYKIIFILSILANVFTLDTKDPEFVKQFKLKHITEGDGKSFPKKGFSVKVHYTGSFPDTEKKFDSSRDRGNAFTFTLGKGEVIKCWDLVVERLSIGERVQVVCPSKLAYGERGAGGVIPPNADIAFDIEMLGFKDYSKKDEA